MHKNKILVFLIIVYVLIGVAGFVYENKSLAGNGEPECCFYFKPVAFHDPKNKPMSFGEKKLSEFQLFAVVKKEPYGMRPKKIDITVLALINKSTVLDLIEKIVSKVIVSEHAAKNLTLKKGDFLLLIPMAKYDESSEKDMYDFVKIPVKLTK